jgi:hypothetical protein
MSLTEKDLFIFATGVVGRAMGSGKFGYDEIQDLTAAADAAFRKTFGDPEAAAQPIAGVPFSSEDIGAPPTDTSKFPPLDGETFKVWSTNKIGFGKKDTPLGKPQSECTWGEAHMLCARGDKGMRGFLEWLSSKEIDASKPWATKDRVNQARARAILGAT